MKHRLLIAFLALGVAACDNNPPLQADAGVDDDGGIDAIVPRDASPADRSPADASPADASPADAQSPDTSTDLGPDLADPAPDSWTFDSRPNDTAGAVEAGVPDALTVTRDTSTDVGGVACSPASREMLCTTYCDGIGRVCTRADAQFRDAAECRAACNGPAWACGKPGEMTGNSLFCRLTHMALAGVGEAAKQCPNAGPRSPTCL